MEFAYTKIPSTDGYHSHFLEPIIDLKLYRGAAFIPLKGLIDTGADRTLIHTDIADGLYIDYKKGKKTSIRGISGGNIPVYMLNNLELEILGMANSKIKMSIGFTPASHISVLLGQWGFLENYKVSFEQKNEKFFIESY